MKTPVLDREIRARIDSFLGELSDLVKIAALEAVHDALGANLANGAAGRASRAAARPDGVSATRPRRAAGRAPLVTGGKRSSQAVLETASATLTYVESNPGQRLEEIAKGLSIPTKGLKLPVAKLLQQKKLATKGRKRGTRYFAR